MCLQDNQLFVEGLNQNLVQKSAAQTVIADAASTNVPPPPLHGFDDLLRFNFIIGEKHADSAPKRLLIENMSRLKKAGYTTLFLEHIYYEWQDLADNAPHQKPCFQPTATDESWGRCVYNRYVLPTQYPFYPKPDTIYRMLSRLDLRMLGRDLLAINVELRKFHETVRRQFNYTNLFSEAKKQGIRVVGLDTQFCYEYIQNTTPYRLLEDSDLPQDLLRVVTFNYVASEIIKRETSNRPGEKWLALVGSSHFTTLTSSDFSARYFGIGELTGAKTVLVKDYADRSRGVEMLFNQDAKTEENFASDMYRLTKVSSCPDLKISLEVHTSCPLFYIP